MIQETMVTIIVIGAWEGAGDKRISRERGWRDGWIIY